MTIYNCDLCLFSTNRLSDYTRHKTTQKHIKNDYQNTLSTQINSQKSTLELTENPKNPKKSTKVSKNTDQHTDHDPHVNNLNQQTIQICSDVVIKNKNKYKCNCGKIYQHKQSLFNHKKTCTNKNNEVTELIKKVAKVDELEKTVHELQQIISNQNIIANNSVNNSINTSNVQNNNTSNILNNNQKIINVYSYVNSQYTEAEPIKMLEKPDIDKLLTYTESKHPIEEVMAFQQSKHLLYQFLGEIIAHSYKKKNPAEQQFWVTDITRLSFIVRQALSQNENIWYPDKKGICLLKHIIVPVLDEVKRIMQKYVKDCYELMANSSESDFIKIGGQMSHGTQIIYEINQKELHHKVLNYIAPYFQLELSNSEPINIITD